MANGNLPAGSLAPVNGGEKLRKDAARAYNALDRYCRSKHGKGLTNAGTGACYRKLGRPGDYKRGGPFTQWYAWERYQQGGNLAARPGTSNHGLGTACDFVTIDLVKKYGSRFGWKKTEAFGEAWHYCYVPGKYSMVALWSQVRTGDVIRFGDRGTGVKYAKKRLRAHGFWRWPSNSSLYSKVAVGAVKRFQAAKGMKPDGVIGPKTWKLLKQHRSSK
jgi:hypothetical protein